MTIHFQRVVRLLHCIALCLLAHAVAHGGEAREPWVETQLVLKKANRVVVSGVVQKGIDDLPEPVKREFKAPTQIDRIKEVVFACDVVHIGEKMTLDDAVKRPLHMKIDFYANDQLLTSVVFMGFRRMVLKDGTILYIDGRWEYGQFVHFLLGK